jgi:DNA (cytosine-5)-methyltransferase 1
MGTLNVLDLFSGIGGFSLGLERAGMRTVAFCEIDPFCRKVLAKNFPGVPRYDDVRTLTADRLRADGIAADVICGGFPCQDISVAGKRAGLDGERSGLWSEYARIIGELRPRYVIVENVSALLSLGLDRVLGDLAALGFDAEWHCIPASAVGAHHRRDRLWLVAYPASERRGETRQHSERHSERLAERGQILADADSARLPLRPTLGSWMAEAIAGHARLSTQRLGEWPPEPAVGRVADGIPDRVDPIKTLGNAVVPIIPELIGLAIMKSLSSHQSPEAGR